MDVPPTQAHRPHHLSPLSHLDIHTCCISGSPCWSTAGWTAVCLRQLPLQALHLRLFGRLQARQHLTKRTFNLFVISSLFWGGGGGGGWGGGQEEDAMHRSSYLLVLCQPSTVILSTISQQFIWCFKSTLSFSVPAMWCAVSECADCVKAYGTVSR